MLHNFTLTLQPLWNSRVLNDLLSSSDGFKECRYFESSCEALYRILETVCHKNYAIVTYPSVQLMVILILHMCPPYSQHQINLVHSQNHSRGSIWMHVCVRERVEKDWMCAKGCVIYQIFPPGPSMVCIGCSMVTWVCTNLKEYNSKHYYNVHPRSLLVSVVLSLICAYSLSKLHFLILSLREALKSRRCRPQIRRGRRTLHHRHVLYILMRVYSDTAQFACKAWSMLIDWAVRRR